MSITLEQVKKSEEITSYIRKADESLSALGFTEHSFAHVTHVAKTAGDLLTKLGYDAHTTELARIAGYLHDIGNLVNRVDHSQSGAIMAFRLLDKMGMDARDIAAVVSAIGNHDEGTGVPINPIAAALILAKATCAAPACAIASLPPSTFTTASTSRSTTQRWSWMRQRKR